MYNHPYTKLLWEERDGRKRGEKDWLLIVLWLINKAIDQSVCSRRGTYMGSWTVWNNLSSRGVNPSKRGGCGLIVRWVRGMGGFLHHAEMINAAVRLCHKHNSCSKRLNGYEWFFCVCVCACICVQLWVCYMKTVQKWRDAGCANLRNFHPGKYENIWLS